MTDAKDKKDATEGADAKKPARKPLGLKKTVETGQVRQSFSHGRSKTVTVEVRKKRAPGAKATDDAPTATEAQETQAPIKPTKVKPRAGVVLRELTDEERAARERAVADAKTYADEARKRAEEEARKRAEEDARLAAEREAALKRQQEEEARKRAEEEARKKGEAEARRHHLDEEPKKPVVGARAPVVEDEDDDRRRAAARPGKGAKAPAARPGKGSGAAKGGEDRRRGRLTVSSALSDEDERQRSLAAFRRAQERQKRLMRQQSAAGDQKKVYRDVVVPDSITVQELASRMSERAVDVIKSLMKLGVMATINQTIDADTAELIVSEFGHTPKRVSESDIEIGLGGGEDMEETKLPRPPVVAVMGHVDHGKTSLLDALRSTDVAAGEAGGITQHIGAYQVTLSSGKKITFLDTPGHEAFTAMRARGGKAADVVVLVVAADDSVMPQTVEAIRHARAANTPIVVAINKCDKPSANPEKVRRELLQHEIVVEQLGGDVQSIEVSAKAKMNLEALEEAILLQAEILDLKANPNRPAEGVVIESKLDRGRGPVATVLVQRGTLKVGDALVAGSEWGRVRALVDEHGRTVEQAGPSVAVEVLGLSSTPEAGDPFVVAEDETRARDISEFRQRKARTDRAASQSRGTLAQMFTKIQAGEAATLPIVIKADVQGSLEALTAAAEKLATDEVKVRVLHGAVGGINESDVTLAKAAGGIIVAFNVRASKQARDMAARDGVDIRYYSIIYNVIDDLKALLSGLLAPEVKENFLGYAQIRQVFTMSKSGKVAGCMVTEGMVKRGAKVRLLRDNVVVHEGTLSSLRRFKDEVREVKSGMECGMAFENYQDIREGDMIECFELVEIARQL